MLGHHYNSNIYGFTYLYQRSGCSENGMEIKGKLPSVKCLKNRTMRNEISFSIKLYCQLTNISKDALVKGIIRSKINVCRVFYWQWSVVYLTVWTSCKKRLNFGLFIRWQFLNYFKETIFNRLKQYEREVRGFEVSTNQIPITKK